MKLKQKNAEASAKKFSSIPLTKLLPSMITVLGLCLGITSIRYAIDGKWHIAVSLIIFAAFLDGLDGRIARLLNASSGFGAQLDSLADIVSFGVAPAVVTYLWVLHSIPVKGIGWAVVLIFIACSAIRLARFNSRLIDPKEKNKLIHFFTGIPMPAAACSSLLPLMISFELVERVNFSPWLVAGYIVVIAFMMVSRIPTFSFKKIYIKREYVWLVLFGSTILFAGMLLQPWIIFPLLTISYLVTIPFSILSSRRL